MSTATANFSWILPGVNDPVDANLWGGQLNSNLTSQDTVFAAAGITAAGLLNPTDASFAVVGSVDSTKKLEFEVDGLTTATTRTVTAQDASGTMYITGGQDVAVADGGTGASTALAGFDALKQAATTSYAGVVELATAAVTKAATDTTMPAAVGMLVNHPGVAKAWVNFVGNGANGAATINASYGITSVTKTNTGTFTIVFSTSFTDANYAITGTCQTTGANNLVDVDHNTPPTTSQCVVLSRNGSNAALADSSRMHVHFFGNF